MFSRCRENDKGEHKAFHESPTQLGRRGGREEEEKSLMIITGLRPSLQLILSLWACCPQGEGC